MKWNLNVPRPQPEKDDRVELVDVGDAESRKHDEEDKMAQDEVTREVAELGNLTEEFSARLGKRVPAHVVPFSGPPSNVRLVMLELSGQGEGDDKLVDEALDCSGSDHSQDHARPRPALEEEHDFEDDKQNDDSNGVCNGGEDSTEFLAAHAEDGTHTASHTEEHTRDTRVDTNGTESDDRNTNHGIRCARVVVGDTSSRVDVEVGNQSYSNLDERSNDFTEENVRELGPGNIAGSLL